MGVTIFVLAISVLFQLIAAFLVLRLVRVTERHTAWIFIAVAIFLMAIRRLIPLFRLLSGDFSYPPDLTNELVELAISLLMLVGVSLIVSLSVSIKGFKEKLRIEIAEHQQAKEQVKESEEHFAELTKLNKQLQQEITEHKRAEEMVAEARAFAENIIATVREPLLVLDADLHVITANRSFYEVFKVKQEETEGQLVYELGNRQWNMPKLRELLENILPKNTEFNNFKVEHNFENIGQKIMLLNARRIYRETNRTQMILLAIEDITEHKRAEEALSRHTTELEAINKELEAFTYSVSHDLRAPLRHIDGFVELLTKQLSPTMDEKNRRYFSIISDSAKQMGKLIDDLLVLSRTGRAEMRTMTVNLERLVKEIVDELGSETAGRDILWKISPLPEVQGDSSLLKQALVNLLSNALKFNHTRKQARIEIGHTLNNDETIIFVRDNGVGFDMRYVDKLFGVFQRLHTTSEFEGTGIGLAIVQRIIQRHGGRTWAEGEVNQGATFYFSLPNLQRNE